MKCFSLVSKSLNNRAAGSIFQASILKSPAELAYSEKTKSDFSIGFF